MAAKRKKKVLQQSIKVVHEATAKVTRKKREKVPAALSEKIREMAHAGHSKHQIARTLKVSRSTVQDHTRDIEIVGCVRRARSDLVAQIMERFKGFYSALVRLGVPPRHLSRLAHWLRKKAGLEDDTVLETLVDDHAAYLPWFLEALSHDTDFLKHHPELIDIRLASGDGFARLSKPLPDGRTLNVIVETSTMRALPAAEKGSA